jgi:hypothetical protein
LVIEVVDFEAVAPPDFPEGPGPSVVEDLVTAPRRGRPRKGFDQGRLNEVMRLYFIEKMSMRQVADVVGVSHMSVYRMLSDPNVELLI